jgi:hypothetical protein
MLMASTSPSKDTSWQNGLKRKTWQSIVYKKPSLQTSKHCLRAKGWEKIYQANCPPKQVGVAILLSDKGDFKPELVRREKVHLILIKGTTHQEERTIINLYVPNIGAPNFIKHTLLDLKTQTPTVVVGDFNTLLSPVDRLSRQNVNHKTLELNDTTGLKDITVVYGIFHPATAQYTLFSAAHGTFSNMDHILGHKASLNKYKKIEVIP